jgi:hypothetical protein
MTNIVQLQQVRKELNFLCSKCGAERGCDCNVPAIKKAAAALAANPQKSDRAISAEIGVSQPTVSKARKQSTDKSLSVDARTGLDGKVRKTPKAKPTTPKEKKPDPTIELKAKLATYKGRVAVLERENKRLKQSVRKVEQERDNLRRQFEQERDGLRHQIDDLGFLNEMFRTTNEKLTDELATVRKPAALPGGDVP